MPCGVKSFPSSPPPVGEVIAQRSVGGVLGSLIGDLPSAQRLPPPSAAPTPPPRGEGLRRTFSSPFGIARKDGGEARSGPGPARMTVIVLCAFRLDLTAPPNRFYRGTATVGLF